MKFQITKETPLRRAFRSILKEFQVSLLHFRGTIKAHKFKKETNLKLHIGCGAKLKEGWINIDLNKKADITLDLRRSLPFPNNSCSIIYSEHFLEHLECAHQVESFLEEAYRILKSGGIFSAGVPDTEWPLRAYLEKDSDYFKYAKEIWHPKWCVTRMEHINFHFRQGEEHKFAYDFETLKYILEKSGFVQVKLRNFDPSLDSKDSGLGTLYVDAIKPI